MQNAKTDPTKALPWCMNCVGFHPDHMPTVEEAAMKAHNPQRDAHRQHIKFDKLRLSVYRNKSCSLCGRTYNEDGNLDETWSMTARRVKLCLADQGYFVDDQQVEHVVAKCRQSVEFLFKNRIALAQEANRRNLNIGEVWKRFTFEGCLERILDAADDARGTRTGQQSRFTMENFKGPKL